MVLARLDGTQHHKVGLLDGGARGWSGQPPWRQRSNPAKRQGDVPIAGKSLQGIERILGIDQDTPPMLEHRLDAEGMSLGLAWAGVFRMGQRDQIMQKEERP